MNIVAFIPARAGSKRCPGKNTRLLNGEPLWTWTYDAAVTSGVFSHVYVATDDPLIQADGARIERSEVSDTQPDIEWVRPALGLHPCEAFAILRPTSPFRTAETIRRAVYQFRTHEVHSIRAVEPARQHPGKMWFWPGGGMPMMPVMPGPDLALPFHSKPTQSLPHVYVQNSSLEIAWTYVVQSFGTISGTKIGPFFTHGHEGFAIDTEEDWTAAEQIALCLQTS